MTQKIYFLHLVFHFQTTLAFQLCVIIHDLYNDFSRRHLLVSRLFSNVPIKTMYTSCFYELISDGRLGGKPLRRCSFTAATTFPTSLSPSCSASTSAWWWTGGGSSTSSSPGQTHLPSWSQVRTLNIFGIRYSNISQKPNIFGIWYSVYSDYSWHSPSWSQVRTPNIFGIQYLNISQKLNIFSIWYLVYFWPVVTTLVMRRH